MQYRGITLMLTQDVFNRMLINVIKVNALGQVHEAQIQPELIAVSVA